MRNIDGSKPKYEAPKALSFGEINICSGDTCSAPGDGASQTGNCITLGNGAQSGTCDRGNGAHTSSCVNAGNGYSSGGSTGGP
jgi:hypothetical protein